MEPNLTALVLSYSGKIKLLVIVGFVHSVASYEGLYSILLMYLRCIFWCLGPDCKLRQQDWDIGLDVE